MTTGTARRSLWLSRRALLAHLVISAWVPGCLVAAWWQATIALSGNALSYLYAVEWPAFAIFGVVVWWNFLHDDPAERVNFRLRALDRGPRPPDSSRTAPPASYRSRDEDPALGAYNDYLEQLSRRQRPKTWRRQ